MYREQLERVQLRDGQDILLGFKGQPLGRGLGSAEGPIAVRVWTREDRPIGAQMFRERLEEAVALRRRSFGEDTTAYRVVNGEGDRLPGLVVDRYASALVVVLDDAGLLARREELFPEIVRAVGALGAEAVLFRTGRRGEPKRLETLAGEARDLRVVAAEHGVPLIADIEHGQKTGAFLDQRENRRRVRAMSSGKRVLNLFSYAGGFSLAAALGGARTTTSVDIAAQGHKAAQDVFKRAGIALSGHEFVTQDAFAFLASAAARKQEWDLVISDPPSFAPSEKAVVRALSAYRALHKACAAVVAPGGVLCASSCSSHVDAETFATTLDDASLETARFRLLETHGAPCDHPTLPAFPEGRYLKFFVLG